MEPRITGAAILAIARLTKKVGNPKDAKIASTIYEEAAKLALRDGKSRLIICKHVREVGSRLHPRHSSRRM